MEEFNGGLLLKYDVNLFIMFFFEYMGDWFDFLFGEVWFLVGVLNDLVKILLLLEYIGL